MNFSERKFAYCVAVVLAMTVTSAAVATNTRDSDVREGAMDAMLLSAVLLTALSYCAVGFAIWQHVSYYIKTR